MKTPVKVKLRNMKGNREYLVNGTMWGDGTIYCHNPKPERYPDWDGLATAPDVFVESDPKRLYWTDKKFKNEDLSEIAPFRIASIVYDGNPVVVRGRKR